MANRTCSYISSSVHPDEVLQAISGLSNSSSFGLDKIDSYIIKLVRYEITPAVTHIINLSLQNQEFPEIWKKSKIVPLFKKGDPLNPKNYRPVAIIPTLSKVLEKIISKRVLKYLNKNSLLHASHHAYRETLFSEFR